MKTKAQALQMRRLLWKMIAIMLTTHTVVADELKHYYLKSKKKKKMH